MYPQLQMGMTEGEKDNNNNNTENCFPDQCNANI